MKKFLMGLGIAMFMVEVAIVAEEKDQNDLNLEQSVQISKNGVLLGIELNGGSVGLVQNGEIKFVNPNPDTATKSSNTFAFDGGIKLGYQHYFGLGLGIRVGGYLGVGNKIGQKLFVQRTPPPNLFDYEIAYLPIKTGIDFEGLWDFWEEGKHTLGLSFGLGYRFTYWKNTKNISNSYFKADFSHFNFHEVYPQIGLFYYYEKHQISISYRFGDILKQKSVQQISEVFSIEESGVPPIKRGKIQTELTQKSCFSINYSYRF